MSVTLSDLGKALVLVLCIVITVLKTCPKKPKKRLLRRVATAFVTLTLKGIVLNMSRNNVETSICIAFIQRLKQFHPEIHAQVFHIKNESDKAHHPVGIRKGVYDYLFPVSNSQHRLLWIEFKKPGVKNHKNGGRSDEQVAFAIDMESKGDRCEVAYSWQDGERIILDYISKLL